VIPDRREAAGDSRLCAQSGAERRASLSQRNSETSERVMQEILTLVEVPL